MIVITLLTCADVFLRYVFKSSILGTYEMVEMLLTCVFFGCLSEGQIRKSHIHVFILLKKFPIRLGNAIFAIETLAAFFIACMMTYAALLQTFYAIEKGLATTLLHIPQYPFYIIETLAFLIFVISMLPDVIKTFLSIKNEECSEDVRSHWNG